MKILIADDDPFTRLTLNAILEQYGECLQVGDGIEAVDAFDRALTQGEAYRLVLLDIMMPHMDGKEALKKIRQLEKNANVAPKNEAVIFMVTALDSVDHVFEAFKDGGCTDYITKNSPQQKLIEKMQEYKLIQ